MAHADYNCCAICDCKMDFSYEARTKDEICVDCLKALRNEGLLILDISELEKFMKEEKAKKVIKILDKIGFKKCCYNNKIDDIYNNLLEPKKCY